MRLTNYIREAFIRSALADVPNVGYAEEARKIITKDAFDRLPFEVQEMTKDPRLEKYVPRGYESFEVFSAEVYTDRENNAHNWNRRNQLPAFSKEAKAKLQDLVNKSKEQHTVRTRLEQKLRQVAYSVTTRKALVESLPEFEKYLPPEQSAASDRSVPVIVDVVKEFKDAGWPKPKL